MSIEHHNRFVKEGTDGYSYQYTTIDGIKQGPFSKSYMECICCNLDGWKSIHGQYLNGKLDSQYSVNYTDCKSYCSCNENDDPDDYTLSASINFNQGLITSFRIKLIVEQENSNQLLRIEFEEGLLVAFGIEVNGQKIDQSLEDFDVEEKKMIVALLDLDNESKKYLCEQLKIDQPQNSLNRFYQISDNTFENKARGIVRSQLL